MAVKNYRIPTYPMDIPTFVDVKKKETLIDLKVAKLGTIENFYPESCTADVKIQIKFNEKTPKVWDYPIIPKIPVVKSKYFSTPINKGDGCLIIFLDTDFSAWLEGGYLSVPSSSRLHNLNDAIAVMGVDTLNDRPLFGKDNTNTIIDAKEGKIDFKNKNGNLTDILQGILTLLGDLNKSLDQIKNTYFPYVRAGMDADLNTLKSAIESLVVGNYNIPT